MANNKRDIDSLAIIPGFFISSLNNPVTALLLEEGGKRYCEAYWAATRFGRPWECPHSIHPQ